MSQPIKIFRKTVVERRRLYIDYSCWLEENEVLTDFQVTISPYVTTSPLVITNAYADATFKKMAMFIAGGQANTDYTIQMVVRTDEGQVKRDDIGMRVMP
jgi:hypothetical protein